MRDLKWSDLLAYGYECQEYGNTYNGLAQSRGQVILLVFHIEIGQSHYGHRHPGDDLYDIDNISWKGFGIVLELLSFGNELIELAKGP